MVTTRLGYIFDGFLIFFESRCVPRVDHRSRSTSKAGESTLRYIEGVAQEMSQRFGLDSMDDMLGWERELDWTRHTPKRDRTGVRTFQRQLSVAKAHNYNTQVHSIGKAQELRKIQRLN